MRESPARREPEELRWGWLDYDLPADLIAQSPAAVRDASRLLVVHRRTGTITHHVFRELPELLHSEDLLVFNDTAVLPARLVGRRARTGGKWEGLYVGTVPDGTWELLCQTRGRLAAGEWIDVEPGPLRLELVAKEPSGHWRVRPHPAGCVTELLQRHGRVPLPPYIRKGVEQAGDRERYQTVYAKRPGAVAAPTAGLHFSEATLQKLEERGIARAFVTLHVGLGTFQPIMVADLSRHAMHREQAELPADTVSAIAACQQRGGNVVAVGTTSVRVLETVARSGPLRPWSGETDLFIRPPFDFRVVTALITNFHLPRSTLLLLAAAFAGIELLQEAYAKAIEQRYRFYSYGDAMLIW